MAGEENRTERAGHKDTIDLVASAQQGDPDALNALFARYYERIRQYVHHRMSARVRSYMESSDVVQDAMLGAIEDFDNFEVRDESSFLKWMATIVENKIRARIDYFHAQKRDRRREQALAKLKSSLASGELHLEPVAPITLPGDRAARNEEKEHLDELLDELREDQREVILLRNTLGVSWKEIARALGKPTEDAARQFYSRALTALSILNLKRRS